MAVRQLYAAAVQHLCACRGKLAHFGKRNFFQPPRALHPARVGRIHAVDIRINEALRRVQRAGQRNGAGIRAAAAQRGNIAAVIHALKPGGHYNAALRQLAPDAADLQPSDDGPGMAAIGAKARLPAGQRDRRHPQRLQCHAQQGCAGLLARGQQGVQLPRAGAGRNALRLPKQVIRRVALRGNDGDHLISGALRLCDQPGGTKNPFAVSHRAAAKLLHDQSHEKPRPFKELTARRTVRRRLPLLYGIPAPHGWFRYQSVVASMLRTDGFLFSSANTLPISCCMEAVSTVSVTCARSPCGFCW